MSLWMDSRNMRNFQFTRVIPRDKVNQGICLTPQHSVPVRTKHRTKKIDEKSMPQLPATRSARRPYKPLHCVQLSCLLCTASNLLRSATGSCGVNGVFDAVLRVFMRDATAWSGRNTASTFFETFQNFVRVVAEKCVFSPGLRCFRCILYGVLRINTIPRRN